MRPRHRRWSSRWRPGPARSIEAGGRDTPRRRGGSRRAGAARSCGRCRPGREPLWPGAAGPVDDARQSAPERSELRSHTDARGADAAGARHPRDEQLHERGAEWRGRHPDRARRAHRARRDLVLHLARRPPARARPGSRRDRRRGVAQRIKASPQAPQAESRRAPAAEARASEVARDRPHSRAPLALRARRPRAGRGPSSRQPPSGSVLPSSAGVRRSGSCSRCAAQFRRR